jgi:hypothetical protein
MNMNHAMQSDIHSITNERICHRCGKHIGNGWAFAFRSRGRQRGHHDAAPAAEVIKCFSCALKHRPVLKRSLTAAIVVGTVLTMLNQGDALFAGHWDNTLIWKIPLTYCVPLLVATYGALTSSRK